MDTGYPRDERPRHPKSTIKHEPIDDSMTNSNGDFAVNMSRSDGHMSNPHRFISNTMESELNGKSFYPSLYSASKHLVNPQALSSQRHLYNPMNSLPSDQSSFHSPLALGHQVHPHLHYLPSHPRHHQKSPPPTHSTSASSPPTPAKRRSSSPKNNNMESDMEGSDNSPVFKIKDSSGKLALIDVLSPGSSSSLDFLPLNSHQRAKREFVPDNKKDNCYWNKRLKNNDSARRSRVKRKALEKLMESRLMELQKENIELRHEMQALKRRFGIAEDTSSPSLKSMGSDITSELSSTISREDDLEQQSAGSDDSHSHDDSRTYNVGSMSALSHSLSPAQRDRTDSFGSGSSSRPESRDSPSGNYEYMVRTDKSGALDLRSDPNPSGGSNYSGSPGQSLSPEGSNSPGSSKGDQNGSIDMEYDEKRGTPEMRGYPLKCRWKREMLTSSYPSSTTSQGQD